MTEEQAVETTSDKPEMPDELTLLKAKADDLAIKYHPKIGISKLKQKLSEAESGIALKDAVEASKPIPTKSDTNVPVPLKMYANNAVVRATPPENETKRQRAARLRKEASRLVRVRVACMNPNKRDWQGEVYSVGNSVVGFHKKFVPFNVDEGWHVPYIIYKHMLDRKCQIFYNSKGARPGDKIRKGKLINELSVELMDPLTAKETAELKAQQAISNSID